MTSSLGPAATPLTSPRSAAGTPRYESNARFVRWSDGSLQLLLGDEVLDTAEQAVAGDNHYLFVRHQGLIQVGGQGLYCA